MIRLIIIALLAFGAYYTYLNWGSITANLLESAKQDKTVQAVGGTRGQLNSETNNVLD
jgi:hypothetical protein